MDTGTEVSMIDRKRKHTEKMYSHIRELRDRLQKAEESDDPLHILGVCIEVMAGSEVGKLLQKAVKLLEGGSQSQNGASDR